VVNLLVLYGDSAVCIDHYEGDHMLQVSAPLGEPLPLHIGASPKILLAFMPEPERSLVLERIQLTPYTPQTITDKEIFRRKLEEIRSCGYAVDEGDFETGVYAIGAPVRDHSGEVVAGITVTIPVNRYSLPRKEELIGLILSTTQQLSKELGYRGK
jgi:DNA-binding IclR family transcriptional regulator